MELEETTPRPPLKGFKLIGVEEAVALRQDDPELASVVQRAARLGLPLLETPYTQAEPGVRDLLPAPMSRRLNALPLAAKGSLLAVLLNDPEGAHPIEFAVSRRVVPILARLNLVRLGLLRQFDRTPGVLHAAHQ